MQSDVLIQYYFQNNSMHAFKLFGEWESRIEVYVDDKIFTNTKYNL